VPPVTVSVWDLSVSLARSSARALFTRKLLSRESSDGQTVKSLHLDRTEPERVGCLADRSRPVSSDTGNAAVVADKVSRV
jgi:hypothetical protein